MANGSHNVGQGVVTLSLNTGPFFSQWAAFSRQATANAARLSAQVTAAFNSQITNNVNSQAVAVRNLGNEFRNASGQAAGFWKTVASFATGSVIADVVMGGIQRAQSSVTGLVQEGLAYNMTIQQAETSLTVLLGSLTAARRLVGEIKEYAAKTPFEFPELQQAATALLATKQVGEREVLPMLKSLGDAAAGSSEGFAAMPRIIRAVSQMFSKGKVQAEEMLQLAEAGVPAWTALASVTGKTSAELQALGAKGKLGPEYIKKLVEGLGKQYAGLADRQSRSLSGLMSTLRDQFRETLGTVTVPLFERLTSYSQRVVDLLGSPRMGKFAEHIASGVDTILTLLDRVAVNPVFEWLEGKGSGFKQLESIYNSIAKSVSSLIDAVGVLSSDLPGTMKIFQASAIYAIDWLNERLDFLFTKEMPRYLELAGVGLVAAFTQSLTELVPRFEAFFEGLSDIIVAVLELTQTKAGAKMLRNAAMVASLSGNISAGLLMNRHASALEKSAKGDGSVGPLFNAVGGAIAKIAAQDFKSGGRIAKAAGDAMKNVGGEAPKFSVSDGLASIAHDISELFGIMKVNRGENVLPGKKKAVIDDERKAGSGIAIPAWLAGMLSAAKGGDFKSLGQYIGSIAGGASALTGNFAGAIGQMAANSASKRNEFVGFDQMNRNIQQKLNEPAVKHQAKIAKNSDVLNDMVKGAKDLWERTAKGIEKLTVGYGA